MSEVIKSRSYGHRVVMGTRWPREAILVPIRKFGRKVGYSVQMVCNGACEFSRNFRTFAEAERYLEDLGPERD